MKKTIKYFIILLPIFILGLLLVFITYYSKMKSREIASVNGRGILADDFKKEYEIRKKYYIKKAGSSDFLNKPSGKGGLTIDEYLRKKVLDDMIIYKLIEEDSKNKGIEIEDTWAKNEISQLKKNKNLKKELEEEGISEGYYKDKLIRDKIKEEHEKLIVKGFNINEDLMKKYYEDHKNDYFLAKISHILLNSLEDANKVKGEIGTHTFEELANNYSEDRKSADQGGFIGEFKPGVMEEVFDETIKKLNPGEISEPVKSKFGYHIIRLDDKLFQPFNSVKDDINQKIKDDMYQEYVKKLKEKADIKMYVDEVGSKDNKEINLKMSKEDKLW